MDKINGKTFVEMLSSGSANLNNSRKEVDALNVFPVPDGDTGTNMSMTFNNGLAEVKKSGSENLPVVAKTLSRGMLMGARGNSGVILSQIFRGFFQGVGEQEELDTKGFSSALFNGALLAYKAVMRPTEGTILTVIRESSEYANIYVSNHPECTLDEYFDLLCKEAKASLDRTPELLPVLKEARVVDSGGTGLLRILEGFHAVLQGNPITEQDAEESQANTPGKNAGYRTEYILVLSEQGKHLYKEEKFRNALSQMGENITVVQDQARVKIRLNSMMPGEVLNFGQRYGEFEKVSICNAGDQSQPSLIDETSAAPTSANAEPREYGLIAVAAGEGLKKLFNEYRVDEVVSGGQTMNPSTEDFVSAVSRIPAKHIYILPNNSNIIMAAKAAASVIDNKHVEVLETVSIPQGISACIAFNPEDTPENNLASMQEAISMVHTGQITYAIKNTTVDGRSIKKGDYMGIFDKKIVTTTKEKVSAACELIDQMCSEPCEIVTIIKGCDATEAECKALEDHIREKYSVDIDVEDGGQPVYCFIIGVE